MLTFGPKETYLQLGLLPSPGLGIVQLILQNPLIVEMKVVRPHGVEGVVERVSQQPIDVLCKGLAEGNLCLRGDQKDEDLCVQQEASDQMCEALDVGGCRVLTGRVGCACQRTSGSCLARCLDLVGRALLPWSWAAPGYFL